MKALGIAQNLDMLRSVAVFYVVFDHTLTLLGHPVLLGVRVKWLGSLGVMFFFVHTCLVLMMSLERSAKNLSFLKVVAAFYVKRIFRLYPLSILTITCVLVFHIPSAAIQGRLLIAQVVPSKTELVLNVLLMQNFHVRSIVGVMWTLPFEVQMYSLLPFLFSSLARRGRLLGLFGFWVVGWVAAYLARPHLIFVAHFIPGAIAYVILKRGQQPKIPGWLWPLFVGLLSAVFLLLKPSLLSGGIVCLVLGTAVPYFESIDGTKFNLITHNVAKYSYGIYLVHVSCLWFAFIALRGKPFGFQAFTFALLLFGLPVALFHMVEDPLVQVGFWVTTRWTGRDRKGQQGPVERIQVKALEESASGL